MPEINDQYPNVNNVVSYISDEDSPIQAAPPDPTVILLFGTAEQGPLYKPVSIDDSNIEDVFGSYVNDPYGDLMIVKGYKEIRSVFPQARIRGVRVGNATRAKLDLYENQNF